MPSHCQAKIPHSVVKHTRAYLLMQCNLHVKENRRDVKCIFITFVNHVLGSQTFFFDVSSAGPSSEQMEELWVMCGFICSKWSYTTGGKMVTRKLFTLTLYSGKFTVSTQLIKPNYLVTPTRQECHDTCKHMLHACPVLGNHGFVRHVLASMQFLAGQMWIKVFVEFYRILILVVT